MAGMSFIQRLRAAWIVLFSSAPAAVREEERYIPRSGALEVTTDDHVIHEADDVEIENQVRIIAECQNVSREDAEAIWRKTWLDGKGERFTAKHDLEPAGRFGVENGGYRRS